MSTNPPWREMPFSEFATLQRGADLPVQSRQTGSYPVLASNGVVGFHSKPYADGPGVVTGRSGTIGKPTFIGGPYWPLNTVLWVSNFHGNSPRFAFYFFQFFDFAALATGTSVPTLNRNFVHAIPIHVPPLPEQTRIAAILWKVQRAIEVEEKLIATVRELRHAAMQQLFERGLSNEERHETEIGHIPASWSMVFLQDVCSSSAFGPRFSSSRYIDHGGVITLRTTDISEDGEIDWTRAPAADLNPDHWLGHLLQINDCVVTRSGTCGIVAVFEGHERPVLPGAFLIRVRLNDKLLPHFFRYFANSEKGQKLMAQLAQGAIQKNISATRLMTFRLPLPSLREQLQIVLALQAFDKKIDVHVRKRSTLKALFGTLLHELMTGRIRTHDLDIDVSDVAAT